MAIETLAATPVPAATSSPAARRTRSRSVLMVGPRLDVRGGISTVVRGYRDGGLFERFGVVYIATHRDGSASAKARQALRGYVQLCGHLLRADAPLVHIHLASRASFWRKSLVCLVTMLRGRPYILHVHGGGFGKFYDEECGVFAKWYLRTLLARAALVLGLSEHWCAQLARISPRANIRRLRNAVRLPKHAAAPPADSVRVLYAGLISEPKGPFDLVRAFARIAFRFPAAQLVCAGAGEVDALTALAKQLHVEERVSRPGWLDSAAMANELARASVFVLPSYAEGLPMSLLEAMSWGLAVVTTPVGGIPEVVEHDRNGLLVAPGNLDALEAALTKVLESPAERERLGTAARATVSNAFTLDSTLEELAAIYREFGIADPWHAVC
jgi:glycosyltransferase involved in cell wall biosynthesis